jgi:hypothetical protein
MAEPWRRRSQEPRYYDDGWKDYTEAIVPAAPRKDHYMRWLNGSRGNVHELSMYRHQDGAAKLVDIIARCCVRHLSEIEPEHLQDVPWEIGRRIWHECAKGCVSLIPCCPQTNDVQGLYQLQNVESVQNGLPS